MKIGKSGDIEGNIWSPVSDTHLRENTYIKINNGDTWQTKQGWAPGDDRNCLWRDGNLGLHTN